MSDAPPLTTVKPYLNSILYSNSNGCVPAPKAIVAMIGATVPPAPDV